MKANLLKGSIFILLYFLNTAIIGCGLEKDSDSDVNGQSHWLSICQQDEDCTREGFQCVCGWCAPTCQNNDDTCPFEGICVNGAHYDLECNAFLCTPNCGDNCIAPNECNPITAKCEPPIRETLLQSRCQESGGQWQEQVCGNAVCGQFETCDTPSTGCNCGPLHTANHLGWCEADENCLTDCFETGCLREECSDEDVFTPCEGTRNPCYRQYGQCARNQEGQCGWWQSEQLLNCLADTEPMCPMGGCQQNLACEFVVMQTTGCLGCGCAEVTSCDGYCGFRTDGCWCDATCQDNGDCCPDYQAVCSESNAELGQ